MSSIICCLFYPGFPSFRILFNSFFHKGAFIKSRIISVIELFFSDVRGINWGVENRVILMRLKFSF